MRDIYSNTKDTGFTSSFFSLAAISGEDAHLAAPFFTDYSPIKTLTDNGCHVRLLIRLCDVTSPNALKQAMNDPRVRVRYYTTQSFHAKLYIIGEAALIGSANLTTSGLQKNREVSVVLRRDKDASFLDAVDIYEDLWTYAAVLNPTILDEFTRLRKTHPSAPEKSAFEKTMDDIIPPIAPHTITVGSDVLSKERQFLQNFKRKYDEELIPLHREIMSVAQAGGFGRPEYKGQDPQIEMGRFLGWIRLVHGAKNVWREVPLLDGSARKARIQHYVREWQSTSDTVSRDMYAAETEIKNIAAIRHNFRSSDSIVTLSYNDMFETLLGCHAFLEQLRFAPKDVEGDSGIARLKTVFRNRNALPHLRKTLTYLLCGRGEGLQRAYDCLHNPRYKLNLFGEACVMELLGWYSDERPPFNNRTLRGMRFLGYDVEHHVAGA